MRVLHLLPADQTRSEVTVFVLLDTSSPNVTESVPVAESGGTVSARAAGEIKTERSRKRVTRRAYLRSQHVYLSSIKPTPPPSLFRLWHRSHGVASFHRLGRGPEKQPGNSQVLTCKRMLEWLRAVLSWAIQCPERIERPKIHQT